MASLSLDQLKNKDFSWEASQAKVAILGYGAEGQTSYKYLTDKGLESSNIFIYDANPEPKGQLPEGAKFYGGLDYIAKLNQDDHIDIIFRSPPVNPNLITSKAVVWSSTNEFFARSKSSKIIGVTGTKGKGTTSSLIYQMLKNDGQSVHLLGNIGKPALSLINQIQNDDYVVFEMSSFQLWDIKFSPKIAVILMVTEDHLDVHDSLKNYHQAKLNIVKFQKDADDVAIYFAENKVSTNVATSNKVGIKMPFPDAKFAHIAGSNIKFNDQVICSIKDVKLIGEHNLQNIMAAINTAKSLGLSSLQIADAIKKFKGLPHRLQFTKTVSGIDFYDNSQATGPDSVRVSIESFKDLKKVVLMGGRSKGVSFDDFFELKNDLTSFIFYGESGYYLADLAQKNNQDFILIEDLDFKSIIIQAYKIAKQKNAKIVILSPGLASFDMFKDYIDRGNQFNRIVCDLK
jgi:UDP-N-acetylmuramoylalanine--D-glutamate ligase